MTVIILLVLFIIGLAWYFGEIRYLAEREAKLYELRREILHDED